MTDIATITGFIGAIRTASEIGKAIANADASLEKAQLKTQIASLLESLADARIKALDVQDLLREKDQEIAELRTLLEGKQNFVRHDGCYYETNANGDPIGDPYCSHCWEANGRRIHLNDFEGMKVCAACSTVLTD